METIIGGVIAALAGLIPWFVQRRIESDEKRKEGHWTRWDDGLAKAIQSCNEQLSLLGLACSAALDASDDPDVLAKGWEARRAFLHSVNVGAAFFDDDLVELLRAAETKAWDVLNRLKNRQDKTYPDRGGENFMAILKALEELYAILRGELRIRFKTLMNVQMQQSVAVRALPAAIRHEAP